MKDVTHFSDLEANDILFMKDIITDISKNNMLKYDDIIKARRSIVLNFYNKLEDIIAEDYKKGILIEDDRSNTDTLYKPIITRRDVFDYGLDMGFNIQFVPIISVNASAIADYEETNQQQITNTNTNERNDDE